MLGYFSGENKTKNKDIKQNKVKKTLLDKKNLAFIDLCNCMTREHHAYDASGEEKGSRQDQGGGIKWTDWGGELNRIG